MILASSISRSSATLVWEEDFENPPFDDWFLYSYNYTEVYLPTNYPPIIASGTLQMPWNNLMEQTSGEMIATAIRNSSVAYGTWSFDFHIAEGKDHEFYGAILLVGNDYGMGNLNLSESSFNEPFANMRAYIIYIKSGTTGWPAWPSNSITLRRWTGLTRLSLGAYQFSSPITGSHNMTITRDSTQGEFHVYVDSEHLFNATNNEFITSEVFAFTSFMGDISFDNLTVSNTVDVDPPTATTTESFIVWLLFPSLMILVVIRRKR